MRYSADMLGTITITDLEIHCIVGILEHERADAQAIFVDVELDTDFAQAHATEDVRHTVNYAEVSQRLAELAQMRKYQLIETMVEDCCALIFDRWPAVTRARVTIKKPTAVPDARYPAVMVERFSPGS